MIDRERFRQNFVYLDKDVVIEIIDIFLGEYKERLAAIHENISALDFTKLKFNAHSLKGVIANFMDPVTIELSKRMDEKAKLQDSTDLMGLYTELKTASEELARELEVLRSEITS